MPDLAKNSAIRTFFNNYCLPAATKRIAIKYITEYSTPVGSPYDVPLTKELHEHQMKRLLESVVLFGLKKRMQGGCILLETWRR